MHNLPKPLDSLVEHLNNCTQGCRYNKVELQNFIPKIVQRANNYDEKATQGELFTLTPIENIPFDKKSLVNLYTSHMSKKNSSGREIYDKLILSAKGSCPFCSQGNPTTIDHFLPKTVTNGFPELSIVPINLVPCCKDCNHKKTSTISYVPEEQLIHPYYDNINKERWLFAEVNYEINNEPTIIFYVDCPSVWDEILKARINHHFDTLSLNSIYSQQAASELSGKKHRLLDLFSKGGEETLKEYLREEAISWEQSNKNSWQTAMYFALAEDERFSNCKF